MIDKALLEHYYQSNRLSMSAIAEKLGVSSSQVSYWMKKSGIDRRNRSEATYLKRNPDGDPFRIARMLSSEMFELKVVSLGLYWGEGTKSSLTSIRLGNTDPSMIRIFRKFLIIICGVSPSKMQYWLQLFSDINVDEAIEYWRQELDLDDRTFKPSVTVSHSQSKGTYRRKSRYGVLQIVVCNKKLRNWLISEINKLRINS